ncbi:MAG: SH3 domain-containing protein [Candidatus Zixiibacteriota bacterium]|nr:MAG: SH3 domain-containing protein [candidate division Zixibacteria bacterium]
MKQVRVIKPHTSEFPDPIKVKAGAQISVEDRKTNWPGWLWCRTDSRLEGWVPSDFIDRVGNTGTLRRDYDATELTVAVGDTLEALEEASNWVLCRTDTGLLGWVPCENVEPA